MLQPVTETMSVIFTPNCILTKAVALLRSLLPLNSVTPAIRFISEAISSNSWFMIARCSEEYEPVTACCANCFIRIKASSIVAMAPSTVCSILMPSRALRTPCRMTAISAFISSRTARPAASSLAPFIRNPDESLSTESARAL